MGLRRVLPLAAVTRFAPVENAKTELHLIQQMRFRRPRSRPTDRLPQRTPVREERDKISELERAQLRTNSREAKAVCGL